MWQVYPIEWRIQVPSQGIDVRTTTRLENQELVGKTKASISYWEGAIDITGSRSGVGYLEMTGYRNPGQPVASDHASPNIRMRSTASISRSSEFATENRTYPSPNSPNDAPLSAAIPASCRSLSSICLDVSPVPVIFGNA